jgi:glycosyltransferase involved in cell wall biosynthesis
MKTVLILGADFSPSSYPPALRIRFFARHLPEFGWKPIILTTDPSYYEQPFDPANDELLPNDLKVIRTPALSSSLTRKLGVGDIGIRSLWHHWQALRQIFKRERIDLLFVPVPPYLPMIVGRLANYRFGVPYVVDYIDPWVTDYYAKLPKRLRPPKWFLANLVSRTVEPFALRRVAHIVAVSKGTIESVTRRYSWLRERQTSEIPYGAEASDFDFLRQNPRRNPVFDTADGCFHLSYVGRGGPDTVTAVEAILQAVKLGRERSPELFACFRLHFVGTSYDARGPAQVLPLAAELAQLGVIDEHPARVSYLDALQILLDSNALLLIGSDETHYTASKIFPYILSEKPLVVVSNEASTVVRILRETNAGRAITFSDRDPLSAKVEDITSEIEQLLANSAAAKPATDWKAVDQYSARSMAQRLATAFEQSLVRPIRKDATGLSRGASRLMLRD